jgi:flagellar biosynthesis/type III secretory pathway protein FliH
MAKMNIAPEDRRQVKFECLRLMATLRLDRAKMQLISGFVDTYLQLSAEEEALLRAEIGRMEPTEQEVVMEIVTSWMREGIEQGLQQGLQQGRQEGRQEGEVAIILRLLNRRIGTVDLQLQEHIRQLSLTQLEDLAEALLDFSNEADLVAWLQQVSRDDNQPV